MNNESSLRKDGMRRGEDEMWNLPMPDKVSQIVQASEACQKMAEQA